MKRGPRPRRTLIVAAAVAAVAIGGGVAAAVLATSRGGGSKARSAQQAKLPAPQTGPSAPAARDGAPKTKPAGPPAGRPGSAARQPGSQRGRSRHSPRPRGDVAVAAAYLGLAPARLREQLRSGRPLGEIADGIPGKSSSGLVSVLVKAHRARLAAARAEGKLDRDQERRRLATLQTRLAARVKAVPQAGVPGDLAVAARYLGVSRAQLGVQTKAGRTLAQIADATPGRSARGLIDALVAARRKRLAAALASGAITRRQEKALTASLERRMSERVTRTRRHAA